MSLPKLPYGLPPVPEGWVYAGMGPLPWLRLISKNVNCIGLNDWDPYKGECSGQVPGEQYIVRIGTPEHAAFLKCYGQEAASPEGVPATSPEQKALRDEFAMAALTGILCGSWDCDQSLNVCEKSYEIADAMLQARKGVAS